MLTKEHRRRLFLSIHLIVRHTPMACAFFVLQYPIPTKNHNNEVKHHLLCKTHRISTELSTPYRTFPQENCGKVQKFIFPCTKPPLDGGCLFFVENPQIPLFTPFLKKFFLWKTFFISLLICGKLPPMPQAPTKRSIPPFFPALYLHSPLLKTLWKSLFFIHKPVSIKDVKLIFVCYYER